MDAFENPLSIDRLPWTCDFGFTVATSHWCSFAQSARDQSDFLLSILDTPTLLTGPGFGEQEQRGLIFHT